MQLVDKTNQVLNINLEKSSIITLAFAVMTFFMHLMLHNYNNSQENDDKTINFTSNHTIALNEAIQEQSTEEISNESSDIKVSTVDIMQEKVVIPQPKIIKEISKINIKKIGNISVVKVEKGNTMFEILNEVGLNKNKAHLVAEAINKQYKLSHLQLGNVIQIINLSSKKNDNFKIIIDSKIEILVKNSKNFSTYNVVVNKIDNMKKVTNTSDDQYSQKKNLIQTHSLQKIKFRFSDIHQSIQKAPVTVDIKRDLNNIVQLLKSDHQLQDCTIDVVYEKISSKNSKLFYVNFENHKEKIKVYKYIKQGIVNYVKQNGVILTREKSTYIAAESFHISYPIQNPVIGSCFGMRHHPILHKVRMHKGIDFRASKGTPIYAPADGVITDITHSRGFGKHVRIRHNGTYSTLYAHLDRFANKVVGTKVKRGEVIGYVGRSGIASGEHLHFELHENGRPINPLKLIGNKLATREASTQKLSHKQMNAFRKYQAEIENKTKTL